MNPLGRAPTALGADTPMLACGSMGAGARLGSAAPATPGVAVEVRVGWTDDELEDSAFESGLVGFLRYAAGVVSLRYIR